MRRNPLAGLAAAALVLSAAASTNSGAPALVEDLMLRARFPAAGPGWVQTIPGTRWEGCEPIEVIVNVEPWMRPHVEEALTEVGRAGGRELRITGDTDIVPTVRWPIEGPREAGRVHPPVIIATASRDSTDMLARGDRAAAVANPYRGSYVTGAIVLDAGFVSRQKPGSDLLRAVLLHEIGHVAGLAHAGRGNLMHAHVSIRGPHAYSEADEEGLRDQLGCEQS